MSYLGRQFLSLNHSMKEVMIVAAPLTKLNLFWKYPNMLKKSYKYRGVDFLDFCQVLHYNEVT